MAASGSIRTRKRKCGVRGANQALKHHALFFIPHQGSDCTISTVCWFQGSGLEKHSMRSFQHLSAASGGHHAQYTVNLELRELVRLSQVHTARVADEKMAPGCYGLHVCATLNSQVERLTPRWIQWRVSRDG